MGAQVLVVFLVVFPSTTYYFLEFSSQGAETTCVVMMKWSPKLTLLRILLLDRETMVLRRKSTRFSSSPILSRFHHLRTTKSLVFIRISFFWFSVDSLETLKLLVDRYSRPVLCAGYSCVELCRPGTRIRLQYYLSLWSISSRSQKNGSKLTREKNSDTHKMVSDHAQMLFTARNRSPKKRVDPSSQS